MRLDVSYLVGPSAYLATTALLTGWLAASAWAQNSSKGTDSKEGIVTDWSTHHVIFSDPGTLVDAMMKGRRAQWERIVNDPRYRTQQMRLDRLATASVSPPRAQEVAPVNSNVGGQAANTGRKHPRGNPSNVDWTEQLAPSGSTGGVSEFAFPAKYSLTITTASCRDFVVFPVGNISGSSTQASLIGVDNMYAVCGKPAVRFAYTFNQGEVDNSPVLSLEGTKVPFVESHVQGISGNAIFHVLTLDAPGNPGNGTDFQNPAVPGENNLATDAEFILQGNGIKSGIYVDYSSDTAYVTDDAGFVHKYNPVFEGTPAEITTSPWPIDLSSVEKSLSAPVFDGLSQHLFFVGISGTLYCYTPAGATCGSLVIGGTPNQIQTFVPPIVDITRGTVFAYGNSLSVISPNVLIQASTTDLSLVSQVNVGSLSGNLALGAFDNAYFTNPASGHLYVGGGDLSSAGVLALRRVGFDSNGTMTADEANSFVLQTGPAARGGGVAVTFQKAVSGSGNNCSIPAFDASSDSPNLILVSISATNANTINTPTFVGLGSPTVTQLALATSTNAEVAVYQVTNFTPNASATINVSLSGAAGEVCGAVAFSGVASAGCGPTAPLPACPVSLDTGLTPSVTGYTVPGPGGIVFDTFSARGQPGTVTPGGSQVQQWQLTVGGNRTGAASVSPPTTTMSWTITASVQWAEVAVPLNPESVPQEASFTSLLDVFNTSDSTERLFLGVQDFGFNSGTPNCGNTTCVVSFDTTSGTFPTQASATVTYPGVTQLISDMIIDNVSAEGSNIYYGVNNQGVQISQSLP